MELIVVTGLSGAGRHSVLGALEDSGCTALDNVPPRLLEPLIELESKLRPGRERLVVGMDSRHREFPEEIGPLLERLRARGLHAELLFVEASEEALLRRFSETRRPHPLAGDEGVAAGRSTGCGRSKTWARCLHATAPCAFTATCASPRTNHRTRPV